MNTKDNTTKPELLPCPFCNGGVEVWATYTQKGHKAKIRCGRCTVTMSCGSATKKAHELKEIITASWNRRA